jgi:hypothetical protein
MVEHTALDSRVHQAIIAGILAQGFAPGVTELAGTLDASADDIEASLFRLAENHGLVRHPGRSEVWIAHPFSLSPTNVWVEGPRRGWWAPCLWCALGVAHLAGGDVEIHARIGGEHEPVRVAVRNGTPVDDGLLVHFSVPPKRAWENVVAWCASVQPFRQVEDVDGWCARHGLPRGSIQPLAHVNELARRWYGGYLSPTWKKWSNAEAQAIFVAAGLIGEFWEASSRDEWF